MTQPQQGDAGADPASAEAAAHPAFLGVQALRAAAALMVVAFHAASNLSGANLSGEGRSFASLPRLEWGNAGVDLFFVVSGFVMVWTTRDRWAEPHACRSFLQKRAARILPLYWLLTTAKIAIVAVLPALFRGTHLQPWNTVASYLLIPSLDAEGRVSPVITAGWTLCFEMAFYYVFAASLALKRRPIVVVTPLLAALGALSLLRTPAWGAPASLIDPLLLEFLAGVWVAELARRGRVRGRPAALLALLTAGVAAWLATGFLPPAGAHAWRALVWGAPAALVLYAVVALERHVDFRRAWPLLLIGDASYSIYLTHVLALPPVIACLRRLALPPAGQWAAWFSLLALGTIVGVLVWQFVERELNRAAQSLLRPRRGARAVPQPRLAWPRQRELKGLKRP